MSPRNTYRTLALRGFRVALSRRSCRLFLFALMMTAIAPAVLVNSGNSASVPMKRTGTTSILASAYPDTSIVIGGNTLVAPDVATNVAGLHVSTNSNFKGVLTADPVTGTVRVTNAQPEGSYLVQVKALNPSLIWTKSFTLTVQPGGTCTIGMAFPSAGNVTFGDQPRYVAVGDFNNDGKQDLVAPNTVSGTVSIRLGDGKGGFNPSPPEVPVGIYPSWIAVGDFNNDSNLDFVNTNINSGTVSIRLGDGTGHFTLPPVPEVSVPNSNDIAVGDFNNDGKLDFATTNSSVSIRLGDGMGGFTAPATPEIQTGAWSGSIVIADLNNDGKLDFLTANSLTNNVSVRLGDGLGGFSSPPTPEMPVGRDPIGIAVGDFNKDGNLDFVVANALDDTVSIRVGDGTGRFTWSEPDVYAGRSPFSIAVSDFNNDGKLDFVTLDMDFGSGPGPRTLTVQFGNGTGGFNFPPLEQIPTGNSGNSVVVGDFNSDGKPDLALGAYFGSDVAIHLATCAPYVVTNNEDNGPGTLREGIQRVSDGDKITFNIAWVVSPITLTTGELLINKNLTITGPGANLLTISGSNSSRVFNIQSGKTVTITDLTIANGNTSAPPGGGGLLNNGGNLSLARVAIQNNIGSFGAGMAMSGGITNINGCLIADNNALDSGGGIAVRGGTATISNCTLSGNVATNLGGGLLIDDGDATLSNVTITNNRAGLGDGGVRVVAPGALTLQNSIVAANLQGASPATNPSDIGGSVAGSSSFNLIGIGGSGGLSTGVDGNLIGISPLLAPLADNGGPTKTHALLPGSPAIDAGSNTKLPADIFDLDADGDTTEAIPFDQRGFARITNATVDIGAFESRGFTVTPISGMFQSTPISTSFAAPLVVHVASAFGEPVNGGAVIFMPSANGAGSTFPGSLSLGAMVIIQSGNATSPNLTANNIAGSYAVSATASGVKTAASFPLTNLKGNQSLSISSHAPATASYRSQFTVAADSSSGLAVAYSSSGACTNSGATFTMTSSSGACTVRYDQPGDSNYNAATQVLESVAAHKADQTINLGVLVDKSFGDADFTLRPTATSGLTVSLSAAGNCTVAANKVHLTGAGLCTITASQAGDSNYNAAPNVPQSFTISKASSITVVTSSVNPSDFGETVTFTASVTSAGGVPDGNIQFKNNRVAVGSAVTLSAGMAQLSISSLPAGARTVTADYSGGSDFLSSTGTLAGGQIVRSQPTLSINDVAALEGDSGTKLFSFTATLGAASHLTVTANFATLPGTADFNDFVPASGLLTFDPGETTKAISVTISGDTNFESNEQFTVDLNGSTNATIIKSKGTGTILNDDAQGGFVSFGQSNYAVSESAGSINIVVNRANDVSGAATVDYAISDTGAPSSCGTSNGLASSRCDFTAVAGTLSFAPGETQRTFPILIGRDSLAEGPEVFTVNLSNPTGGAVLATPFGTTVTINDDNSGLPANAIDNANVFVRMHYHDFLNRQGDQSGVDFWTGQMTNCGAADSLVCRVNVSGAFFLSIEFQQTGYLVERMYKTGYGDATSTSTLGGSHAVLAPVVRANEFLADTQRVGRGVVVLQPGWEQVLESNKQAYALEFVQTSRFIAALPTSMTPAQFVDKLNQNAGLVLSPSERTTAINLFSNAADTSNVNARALALRQIAEDQDLFRNEFNRAFVLAQYIGYLRRNPNDAPEPTLDYTGYEFWLTKLNQFNGDYLAAEMVKGFISSDEYRKRFGP